MHKSKFFAKNVSYLKLVANSLHSIKHGTEEVHRQHMIISDTFCVPDKF